MSCLISELNEFCCTAIAAQPQDTQAAEPAQTARCTGEGNTSRKCHTCHMSQPEEEEEDKKAMHQSTTPQPPPTACMNFLEQSETPSEHENNGKNTNCPSLMKQQLRGPKVATCHCTVARRRHLRRVCAALILPPPTPKQPPMPAAIQAATIALRCLSVSFRSKTALWFPRV